jgi:hydrophobic/amphiphilic exporter-1 (mainly G- bacteria), HAE1 family
MLYCGYLKLASDAAQLPHKQAPSNYRDNDWHEAIAHQGAPSKMKLTRLSIERPLTVLMVILAVIIMGVRAYGLLSVDRFPKTDVPYVSITTMYSGASAADVEELIVKKIEDEVAGISGVNTIQSTAQEGSATTSIEFLDSVDSNQAASDVERAVSRVRGSLPSGADEPTVTKANMQAMPIMNLTLSGEQDLTELYRVADEILKPRLLAAPGVAAVTVSGGEEAEIQIQVDPKKMSAYGLTFQDLSNALKAENVSSPIGAVSVGITRTAIRSLGQFSNLEDIQNLIVSAGGRRIQLKDIATVVQTHKEINEKLRLNGQQAVGLAITKQSDANAIATADGVKRTLAMTAPTLPEGMKLSTVTDDTVFTQQSVDSVRKDLIFAVFITGLVLLAFLHVLRSTIIVLLAVPTSLITTFLAMWALGYTLNTLTLLALALTIGILVDDSIVVLENIFTHLGRGEPPNEAAINGRSEIGLAAIAITLTDVVVYLPIAFTGGMVGMLFRQYGITIAVATLCSLLVSFTLTPMLASMWLRNESDRPRSRVTATLIDLWDRSFSAVADVYAGILNWGLYHRPVVIVVSVAAIVMALCFIPLRWIGTEFAPNSDDGKITASLMMPAGTSLEGTDQAVRQFEELLKGVPEVQDVLAQVGSAGSGGGPFGSSGVGTGSITIKLVDKSRRQRSVFQVVDDLRRQAMMNIRGANFQLSTSSGLGGGGGGMAGLQVQLQGPEMATLTDLAQKVEVVMRTVPGVADVRNFDAATSPEWQIKLNRQRMKDLGISSAEVASALRTAVSGSAVSTFQREGQSELDITLVATEATRTETDQIAQIPLKFTAGGTPITMGQIGELTNADSPAQIKREDRQRKLTISGNVAGRAVGDVTDDVMAAIKAQVQVPANYQVKLGGFGAQQGTAFSSLYSALMFSVVLMYMLMVGLFESFVQPLAIMFSLPVAMVGAFGGLFLTGNTLNIFSMMGIIMLMGLVAKNAILLVDFTDILRKQGVPRHDALLQAARLRLRPILMTTFALVFAMIPFVLKLEAGAESRAPLAAVVIGGTISSTLLTLVLVPTMYTYLDSLEVYIRRTLLGRSPRFVEGSAGGVIGRQPAPEFNHGGAGK